MIATFLHWLGTKPLVVSGVAQLVVMLIACKQRKKAEIVAAGVSLVGLVLVVVSLSLRQEAPPRLAADAVGVVASLFFLVPAVKSIWAWLHPSEAAAAS